MIYIFPAVFSYGHTMVSVKFLDLPLCQIAGSKNTIMANAKDSLKEYLKELKVNGQYIPHPKRKLVDDSDLDNNQAILNVEVRL